MKRANRNVFSIWLLFLLITSCTVDDVYNSVRTFPETGWDKNMIEQFNVPITDSIAAYNLYLEIRNDNLYPYQDIWLCIKRFQPNQAVLCDTVRINLSDEHGRWIGSGWGSLYQMEVLYKENFHFKKTGINRIEINHAMKKFNLRGIHDIGLKVVKLN